ncbi:hypothetical protein [Nonomuraea sp. NPDC049625]|uniref:hypothetical protein n=1 Tax=Nonomuraea sp. NPDC049625 TaxID=3155775 RepID=UPI003426CFD1
MGLGLECRGRHRCAAAGGGGVRARAEGHLDAAGGSARRHHGDPLEQIFPNFGGDPDAAFEEGLYIWDIKDPVRPRRLGHYTTGGTGTHRNLYPGGRYVHVAAGVKGFRGNIYTIVDIEHPAQGGGALVGAGTAGR